MIGFIPEQSNTETTKCDHEWLPLSAFGLENVIAVRACPHCNCEKCLPGSHGYDIAYRKGFRGDFLIRYVNMPDYAKLFTQLQEYTILHWSESFIRKQPDRKELRLAITQYCKSHGIDHRIETQHNFFKFRTRCSLIVNIPRQQYTLLIQHLMSILLPDKQKFISQWLGR